MMQSLKYGLVTTAGYVILLTVLFALTAWVEGGGMRYFYGLATPFYIVLTAIGGIVAFLAGFFFPRIFSRMVDDYAAEYPDVPEKYVIQICRGKLLQKYFYNFALGCFFVGAMSLAGKWYFISIGIISGIMYLKYHRKYKNL